jgi:hypothetical protein
MNTVGRVISILACNQGLTMFRPIRIRTGFANFIRIKRHYGS